MKANACDLLHAYTHTYIHKCLLKKRFSWYLAFKRTAFHGLIIQWELSMLHTNTEIVEKKAQKKEKKNKNFIWFYRTNKRNQKPIKKKENNQSKEAMEVKTFHLNWGSFILNKTGVAMFTFCRLILINALWPMLKGNL